MRAEPHIPLFLWVTAALVVHAFGGGGATEIARRLEETLDIRDFASDVRQKARSRVAPVEVTLLEEPSLTPEAPTEPTEPIEDSETDEATDEKVPEDAEIPEPLTPEKAKTPEPPAETEPEPEKEQPKKEAPEDKPKDPVPELEVPKPPPSVRPDRRVAVEQHVQDKNQEDNPDAEFIGEHANRVAEQTRATVTATDANSDAPTLSGPSAPQAQEPGNAEQTRLAQSEDAPGLADRPAGEAGSDQEKDTHASRAAEQTPTSASAAAATPRNDALAARQGQKAREAVAPSEASDARADTHRSAQGSFTIAEAQRAEQAHKAQRVREAIAGIERKKSQALFGLGSNGLTENGVNLNLSHSSARAVVGADDIAVMRKKDGERRLSEHRGGFTNMGLERWKPALENYVATVKPGNQTALNTAHSPFARYLNQIHQRLHQVFAFGFLNHLDRLPADHPLNNMELNTHLEIALNPQDGGIVKLGVTKSSGVTAFDVGALDSVEKAAPYGPPPSSIVSYDGNVYLHWEFHRTPVYACSTYNAHPYILDGGQKTAPPRVAPPPPAAAPEEAPPPPPGKRRGDREEAPHDHAHPHAG